MRIRQAAATARQALTKMVAQKLSVDAADVTVADGVVRARDGRTMSYGDVIAGGQFNVKTDAKAPVKNPREYKYVGKPLQRPDLPAKMTGRHTYVHDLKVPGMLHARVVHPTAIGATVASIDEASIANIPNARVVRIKDFVAVVAESEWNAVRAARQLRVSWTGGGGLPGSDNVYAMMRNSASERDEDLIRQGNSGATLQANAARRQLRLSMAGASHASMGPSCAVADVKPARPRSGRRREAPRRAPVSPAG